MCRGLERQCTISHTSDLEGPFSILRQAPPPVVGGPVREDLQLRDGEVASLTWPQRTGRVLELIKESNAIVDFATENMVLSEGRSLAATVVLFSGGNDSTIMAHLMRSRATHAGMANTGIGIEETRQFVRDTCEQWGLPLLERAPDEADSYVSLVLEHGFPGPGHHYKMFQRLKERAFRKIRNDLVSNPRGERVIFLAGRRRQESLRRADVPAYERLGSIVWVSPMIHWTKPDLVAYRKMYDVPRNEVADLIHMSGECLCGAFAHEDERSEIELWYPTPFEMIDWLTQQIRDRRDIPEHRKTWGWGSEHAILRSSRLQVKKAGYMCGACPSRLADLVEQLRFDAYEGDSGEVP